MVAEFLVNGACPLKCYDAAKVADNIQGFVFIVFSFFLDDVFQSLLKGDRGAIMLWMAILEFEI